MDAAITARDIGLNPSCISSVVPYGSGLTVTFRLLAGSDAPALGAYFRELSEQTRSLYSPHAFSQAMADDLCAAIDPSDTIRMVAVTGPPSEARLVAYFLLKLGVNAPTVQGHALAGISLDPERDCAVAPSVADDFQNRGLGTPLMGHLIVVARRLGRRIMVLWGGTQARNTRAIHFYRKHGFRIVNTFEQPPGLLNHNMMLDLHADNPMAHRPSSL